MTAPQTFYAVFYRHKALDPATVLLPPLRARPAFLDSALFLTEAIRPVQEGPRSSATLPVDSLRAAPPHRP